MAAEMDKDLQNLQGIGGGGFEWELILMKESFRERKKIKEKKKPHQTDLEFDETGFNLQSLQKILQQTLATA